MSNNGVNIGDLEFFGEITAMISHELKNSLAILNENTGLLDDMLLMANKGIELNLERVGRLASDLNKQIDRSNNITSNLNSFAHSVDLTASEISVRSILNLFVGISQRLAILNGFSVEIREEFTDFAVNAKKFEILLLLWGLLKHLQSDKKKLEKASLSAESTEDYWQLNIYANNVDDELKSSIENDKEFNELATRNFVDIITDTNNQNIQLRSNIRR
jgi:signal transduction histidine kinase